MTQQVIVNPSIADYAARHKLVPPLSVEELRDHAVQIDPERIDHTMVLLNNEVWRETVAAIPYERRLLLLPQCLRHPQECAAEMDEFGLLCAECGRCAISELQSTAEALGYVVLVAEGSTVVSKLLEGGKIDAVVGVSCLSALEKSFPHMADGAIPGLAIPLNFDGCIGTQVDPDAIRAAIKLKSSKPWKNTLDTTLIRQTVDGWFSKPWKTDTATERIAANWLLRDGKRWRPFLLACTYSALKEGATELPDEVRRLAIAVECFHKASLVHDDIEDNDDLRYGLSTLHKQYGIPVALNVGDLLVGEGYRWISTVEENASALLRIAAENHCTLGLGQGEELFGLSQNRTFTTGQIIEIFRQKTAPAFGVSLQLGAVAAGADSSLLETLHAFSQSLGIAYQIHDDLEEYKSGEVVDLRASILLALANDVTYQDADPPRASRTPPGEGTIPQPEIPSKGGEAGGRGGFFLSPNLQGLFTEFMVVEKAEQLLEHYKNEAVRALNPLQNALLKSLLRRITAQMLGGFRA